MIKKEGWMARRALGSKINKGMTISEISRLTGHDRKTIRRHLLAEEKPKYSTANKPSKLDTYEDYITFRIKEVPEISGRRIFKRD